MSDANQVVAFEEVVRRLAHHPLNEGLASRIIAIDGPGGAGKSVFAERLARAFGCPPVAHTDDFASWHEPLDWGPRFLDEVLRPLAAGRPARHRRYDWERHTLGDWVATPASATVIVEGVGSSRMAFRPYLHAAIWIETRRAVRLARGLARDGEAMLGQWEQWMAEEDRYISRERPDLRADLVVSGSPTVAHNAEREVEVLRIGNV